MTLSRCTCQKALFAAIAPNFGRQGLHIMTAPIALVHEGCGARHITVDGADDDLRNALAIASDGVHRGQSRALSVASRAGVSLKTQDKCGSGQLRLGCCLQRLNSFSLARRNPSKEKEGTSA